LVLWQRWYLKDNPYDPNPIGEDSLDLFVGRKIEVQMLQGFCIEDGITAYLEGPRGIGASSLGNFVRYGFMQRKIYFTHYGEISLPANLCCYCAAANLLAALSWSLRQKHPHISRDPEFLDHEIKIKDFIIEHGKVCHDRARKIPYAGLEYEYMFLFRKTVDFVCKLGYQAGLIVQLESSSLSLDSDDETAHNFMLGLCDFFKLSDYRWLLAGNHNFGEMLNKHAGFMKSGSLARINLDPIPLKEIEEILQRRKDVFSLNGESKLPISSEVIQYLYAVTSGNIRNILMLCTRAALFLETDHTVSELKLDSAKYVFKKIYQDRLHEKNLTQLPSQVLTLIVREGNLSAGDIAKRLERHPCSISRALSELVANDLIQGRKSGRHRIYSPLMGAQLAWA